MRRRFVLKSIRERASDPTSLAEIGAAGFGAVMTLVLVGLAVELWRSGTFFVHVAPQHLVGLLVAFGALSIASDARRPYGWGGLVALAAAGATAATVTFIVATRAFDGTIGMPLIAAIAVFLPFFLFRRFGADEP